MENEIDELRKLREMVFVLTRERDDWQRIAMQSLEACERAEEQAERFKSLYQTMCAFEQRDVQARVLQ